jgi:hypothetical protein
MRTKVIVLLALVAVIAAVAVAPSPRAAGTITRANWGASVGFAPNKAPAGFAAGEVISAANVAKVEKLLPPNVALLVKKYGLKIWTKNYQPFAPSNSYIDATNKYQGQTKVFDTGQNARQKGIENYHAGLPFPNPQDGLQVAWNYQYAYFGDDATNDFAVYWISGKSGVERSEEWTWKYIMRAMYRTDIQPMPHDPAAAKENIQYYALTVCSKPSDKAGFAALYWRYTEPKDQDGYIYNPAQRRPIRFSFGTRGDAWNNTDLLYEDVRGYLGYPEWMTWTIAAKGTYLAPMNSGIPLGRNRINEVYDFKTPPYWNFKANWEPRPMYVVEAKPKFRDYPYSKMIVYIDAESYYILFKEAYDKKGSLWKVLINAWNQSPNPATLPPGIGTSLVLDLQAMHATAFPWFSSKANVGLKPAEFTLGALRKEAH